MIRSWPVLLLAIGCQPENTIRNLTPEIAVSPPSLEFGETAVGITPAVLPVYIQNAGPAPLEMTLAIDGGDGVFTLSETEATLAANTDEALPFLVAFEPTSYLDYEATLNIESNDETDPLIAIPIHGVGVHVPTADICVDPTVLDFGTVTPASVAMGLLNISNCGDADLHLGLTTQTGSGAFEIELSTDPSNAVIPGDNTKTVVVTYNPTTDTGDNGTLEIVSDDIDEQMVEVLFVGNGGGTLQYPVAEIACPGTSAPPEVVQLDGSTSYDPAGFEPLQFAWSLVQKPDGSAATLSDFITSDTTVFTDIAGDYEVHLQVTNTLGLTSAPAKCVVGAIPADDLHVELTWDTSGVDLDLHLMQNTSASLFDTPEDCNYCNPNPDWGVAGTDDDPRLDLDDRSDGPENINVLDPGSGNASFPVAVHYYDPLGGPATTATVTVYTFGVETYSSSRVLTRNEVWNVGQVNWPAGTFGVTDTVNDASVRLCQ